MDHPPPSRALARALELVRGLALPRGARVLALRSDPAPLVAALREMHYEVATSDDPVQLGAADESLDAAVVVEFLERYRWDRWALQQVHRALKPDAALVLVTPRLGALPALLDPRFVWEGVRKHVRALARRLLPGGMGPPARGARRRYPAAALSEMLARLGYRLEPVTSPGAGLGGSIAWVARRGPGRYGAPPLRPWPDPAAHRARFEGEKRDLLAIRDRWVARHPGHAPAHAVPLDPAAYAGARVLALSPHPDDEILGAGGTLARLIAAGARVTVIQATDGSEAASLLDAPAELRRRVRLEEARAVGRAMGFAAVETWGESNAAFRERDELVTRLARTLAELEPALIFTPFVTDVHPDHRHLTRLLARALRSLARPSGAEVLCYEVWGFVPANRYCVVTGQQEAIERALALYVTAMKVEDYIHLAQDRNYWNACALTGGPGYAEAFYAAPAPVFPDLPELVEEARD